MYTSNIVDVLIEVKEWHLLVVLVVLNEGIFNGFVDIFAELLEFRLVCIGIATVKEVGKVLADKRVDLTAVVSWGRLVEGVDGVIFAGNHRWDELDLVFDFFFNLALYLAFNLITRCFIDLDEFFLDLSHGDTASDNGSLLCVLLSSNMSRNVSLTIMSVLDELLLVDGQRM